MLWNKRRLSYLLLRMPKWVQPTNKHSIWIIPTSSVCVVHRWWMVPKDSPFHIRIANAWCNSHLRFIHETNVSCVPRKFIVLPIHERHFFPTALIRLRINCGVRIALMKNKLFCEHYFIETWPVHNWFEIAIIAKPHSDSLFIAISIARWIDTEKHE